MAEDKFKLPRSSYDEICKIIKAYGRLTQPASLDEVARFCAMNKTAISANNAFLGNIELIEGGQKKSATSKGSDLAQALEHELPDQIREFGRVWCEITSFWEKWRPRLKYGERWIVPRWNPTLPTLLEKRSRDLS